MPLFELSFIYRDFSGATAKKALNINHFRRIQRHPKLPSKITKQPLTHKTRNQVVAQAARGFESHPVRQKSLYVFKREGFSLFCQHFVNKSYFKSGKIDV